MVWSDKSIAWGPICILNNTKDRFELVFTIADKDKENRHEMTLDTDVNDVREPSRRDPHDNQVEGCQKVWEWTGQLTFPRWKGDGEKLEGKTFLRFLSGWRRLKQKYCDYTCWGPHWVAVLADYPLAVAFQLIYRCSLFLPWSKLLY